MSASSSLAWLDEAKKHSTSIVLRGDENYETAKRCWNADSEGNPLAIVTVDGAGQLSSLVKLLHAEHNNNNSTTNTNTNNSSLGSGIAVACGRHSCHAMPDDAVVIDLAAIDHVSVDVETRLARVGGGARLGKVDRELAARGLAACFGHNPTTGVGGLTLSGGFGYLASWLGLAVDALVECEVVMADGTLVRVNDEFDADLMWALRGAGSNFAIVTEFVFRCAEMPPVLAAGHLVYPGDAQRRRAVVGAAVRHVIDDAERRLLFTMVATRDAVVMPIGHVADDDSDAARQAALGKLAPLRALAGAEPAVDSLGPMSYAALNSSAEAQQQPGHWYERGALVRAEELPDALLDAIVAASSAAPRPDAAILVIRVAGKLNERARTDTAFVHRDVRWWIIALSPFDGEQDRDAARAWAKGFYEDHLLAHSCGGYAAVIGDQPSTLESIWAENLPRLSILKHKYDPLNFFHQNRNIPMPIEASKL
jgi:FAD/FMN-containing dehydrogenase